MRSPTAGPLVTIQTHPQDDQYRTYDYYLPIPSPSASPGRLSPNTAYHIHSERLAIQERALFDADFDRHRSSSPRKRSFAPASTPVRIVRSKPVRVAALNLRVDRSALTDITVYNVSPTDPFEYDARTPTQMEYRQPQPSPLPSTASSTQSGPITPRTPPQAVPSSSSARHRNPPPPSPLSKVSSPTEHAPGTDALTPGAPLSPPAISEQLTSPCYIHSYLDKHGSGTLHDYLHTKAASPSSHQSRGAPHHPPIHSQMHSQRSQSPRSHHASTPKPHVQVPHHHHAQSKSASRPISPATSTNSVSGYDTDMSSANGGMSQEAEFDDEGGSLTKQLAETAQGVREMSRELERTRVRSRVQSVLIVTKARDNRLIRLTRELAIYLMQKRGNTTQGPVSASTSSDPLRSSASQSSFNPQSSSDRGMIVYVDAQLRHSKRFDKEGIKRDHPDFFKPLVRRGSSSSASLNTLSAYPSSASLNEAQRKKVDEGQLRYWTSEMCSNASHLFDFVITLGGDGTVLFTSWLFQKIVPPVLPFALGSLGFLTNFDFSSYAQTMDRVLNDGIRVNLRMRFTCTIYRAIAPEEAKRAAEGLGGNRRKAIKRPGGEILMSTVDKAGWEALEGSSNGPICRQAPDGECGRDKEIMCFSTRPVEQFEVLNDLVVDRGPSPYVSLLEVFGDEHHLTTVQADGLTVSTPTGSTAYSLSAGGSLVHPQIPAILLTPICPHTLSFRPMLLPDSMELRICVPYNSRSTAWASFDGRGRVELKQGDHIKVTASKYPFPTVCADKASTDWFSSISRTLRWNEREKQKSFVVVEEDHEAPNGGAKGGPSKMRKNREKAEAGNEDAPRQARKDVMQEQEEAEVDGDEGADGEGDADEEEDDAFDIDDNSNGEAATPSSPRSPQDDQGPTDLSASQTSAKSPPASGVSTPNRFVSKYSAPPPLSQRHLVQKLAAAELREKDNERGQRDEIRSDSSAFRVKNGESAIPPSPETERRVGRSRHRDKDQEREVTPRGGRRDGEGAKEGKAKAFAFFGQDDSGSEMSDELPEP